MFHVSGTSSPEAGDNNAEVGSGELRIESGANQGMYLLFVTDELLI